MENEQHQEPATSPAQDEVSLYEEESEAGKASSSSSSSGSSSSSSSAVGAPTPDETWAGWIEEKKKEYGTPNDWIEASPTAKYYQQTANEFFKGIGQWGHEKALEWFPTYYNYEPRRSATPAHTQQQREEETSNVDLS